MLASYDLSTRLGLNWPESLWFYPLALIVAFTLYYIPLCIYRITFHPLARFPGPKFAGASYLYEFWFDVVCWGKYSKKIVKLHSQYGPIVRVNPDELHCNDPNFVDEIYAVGHRKRNKSSHFIAAFPVIFETTAFATIDHAHHRFRRSAIQKYFSRSSVLKLEDIIQKNAQKLCNKFLAYKGRGHFQAMSAFANFSADSAMEYCFGHNTNFLGQPEWEPNYSFAARGVVGVVHYFRHLPLVRHLVNCVPLSVLGLISAEVPYMMKEFKTTIERLRHTQDSKMAGGDERKILFSELLDADIPEHEKGVDRLSAEAFAILLAGTETTASVFSILTFHLLRKPAVAERLRAELMTVVTDVTNLPSWSVLEKLPYLSAVVQEGLRLSYGSAQRLPRIATDEDLVYEGFWSSSNELAPQSVRHVIPRGYAVGMSAFISHNDESIFRNAAEFIPERWLDDKDNRSSMHRAFLTFSKGSRQCVGMHLAYCEIYVCIAAVTLRVLPLLKLYETDISDVEYDHDEVVYRPKLGSKGVRLMMVDE